MATYHQLKNHLIDQAYEARIPLTGEFEILSQCNFNCAMCYAKNNDPILSKEAWYHIFDMAYNAGMLYALLTGGEIFLHPDFIDIYNYLYDLGVKITLYTNGSMLNHKILATLKKRPPELIAITLYGYDEVSYKNFTDTTTFTDVNRTIDLLKAAKLNLALRTIPLPMIYQHLDKMIEYAKSKEAHLGYFLYVSRIKDQDRLTPKQLLDFEIRMKQAFPLTKPSTHKQRCGAFRNGYFINHQGYMQGCPMMPIPTKQVQDNLKDVFNELFIEWEKMLNDSPCSNCDLNDSCMTCLARRYLEGNVFKCASYLKDIALEKHHD